MTTTTTQSDFDAIVSAPASPDFTCCIVYARLACAPACSKRPAAPVAPGSGIDIRVHEGCHAAF